MSAHPPAGDPHGEIGSAWSAPRGGPRPPEPGPGRLGDGIVFAGVLMLCGGVLAVLEGVAAIAEDDVYARIGSYVYELSLTGWGWIHLALGVLAAATGAALLRGMTWARFTGVFLAALSLVLQFLFLPYEPLWPVVVMAIDAFVIWSLVSWQERGAAQGTPR